MRRNQMRHLKYIPGFLQEFRFSQKLASTPGWRRACVITKLPVDVS